MQGQARVGSDSAMKLFRINSRIGAGITGLAFIDDGGIPRNVGDFVVELVRDKKVESWSIEEAAQALHNMFKSKYDYKEHLIKKKDSILADLKRKQCEVKNSQEKKEGLVVIDFLAPDGRNQKITISTDIISILVAGFDKDGAHRVYQVLVPGGIEMRRNSTNKGMEFGASWIGQTDVVTRIVLGFDGRIGSIPLVNEMTQKVDQATLKKQLAGLEYAVQWGTMTLQDAIDFCHLMIQTTTAIQRFSDGIRANPGDIPGVGGPVDIAVITRENGFQWIQRKKIVVDGNEVDIGSSQILRELPLERV